MSQAENDGGEDEDVREGEGSTRAEALSAVATGCALLLQRIERFQTVLRDTAADARTRLHETK